MRNEDEWSCIDMLVSNGTDCILALLAKLKLWLPEIVSEITKMSQWNGALNWSLFPLWE